MKFANAILIFFVICFLGWPVLAQEKWTRLQTDNGEFSIEMPEGFSNVYEPDGFELSFNSKDYILRDVRLVKIFVEGAAMGFEVYRAKGGAMDPLVETSTSRDAKRSKAELNGVKTRTEIKDEDNYYYISHYFKSNDFLYVVWGLSREKGSATLKRFFDSFRFVAGSKTAASDAVRLSTLSVSPIHIKTKDVMPIGGLPAPKPGPAAQGDRSIIIGSKPRASFTDAARNKNVAGVVQLRIEFAPNGHTPSIEMLKMLSAGLSRQALFAALRIKFLPAEKDGKPTTKKLVIEYSFAIY